MRQPAGAGLFRRRLPDGGIAPVHQGRPVSDLILQIAILLGFAGEPRAKSVETLRTSPAHRLCEIEQVRSSGDETGIRQSFRFILTDSIPYDDGAVRHIPSERRRDGITAIHGIAFRQETVDNKVGSNPGSR